MVGFVDNKLDGFIDDKLEGIYGFNNTKATYLKNNTIHELFEIQVEKSPDNIAAIFGDEQLTYRELNSKANQLARLLRKKGVERNKIVGIMAERSLEMIIGIFAIIKAGGAYLPISPENPNKRIEYLVLDSGIDIILTQPNFFSKCSNLPLEVVNLEDNSNYNESDENIPESSSSRDLIYVIYTSGSTGKPKGVMIEHYSVVNRLFWMQEMYPIDEKDTILQKTPFMFDVSVWEIFWWSLTGSKVCFLKPSYEKFPQAIIEEVEKNKITVMHFVPSMINSFLNYIESSGEVKRIKSLKRVFCSGEVLTAAHVKKFNQIIYKESLTKLTNLYGPTEATVDVTYYDCPTEDPIENIPIGKPINNTSLYIMENNQLLPIGKAGELCIAGDGLARGYLNNPLLTKEKFIENPMDKGQRIYKTGDLARWLTDGNVEFFGRIDNQVKIRGLRIELGEIENIISDYHAVDQCAVVVKGMDSINPRIMAYVVPKMNFVLNELKNYLKNILPEYMIPASYISLESLPLTSNGKVDRNALVEN